MIHLDRPWKQNLRVPMALRSLRVRSQGTALYALFGRWLRSHRVRFGGAGELIRADNRCLAADDALPARIG